jgi:hypothetical protein
MPRAKQKPAACWNNSPDKGKNKKRRMSALLPDKPPGMGFQMTV